MKNAIGKKIEATLKGAKFESAYQLHGFDGVGQRVSRKEWRAMLVARLFGKLPDHFFKGTLDVSGLALEAHEHTYCIVPVDGEERHINVEGRCELVGTVHFSCRGKHESKCIFLRFIGKTFYQYVGSNR